jgi:hypothetical protein
VVVIASGDRLKEVMLEPPRTGKQGATLHQACKVSAKRHGTGTSAAVNCFQFPTTRLAEATQRIHSSEQLR